MSARDVACSKEIVSGNIGQWIDESLEHADANKRVVPPWCSCMLEVFMTVFSSPFKRRFNALLNIYHFTYRFCFFSGRCSGEYFSEVRTDRIGLFPSFESGGRVFLQSFVVRVRRGIMRRCVLDDLIYAGAALDCRHVCEQIS